MRGRGVAEEGGLTVAERIWKVDLALKDVQVLNMPEAAVVLACAVQHGIPRLWFRTPDDEPSVARTFFMHGTGHEVDYYAGRHVGTFQVDDGHLIFHVFEQKRGTD